MLLTWARKLVPQPTLRAIRARKSPRWIVYQRPSPCPACGTAGWVAVGCRGAVDGVVIGVLVVGVPPVPPGMHSSVPAASHETTDLLLTKANVEASTLCSAAMEAKVSPATVV